MNATQRRHQLRAAGYLPIPLFGKVPPIHGKNNSAKTLFGWDKLQDVSDEQLTMWAKTWPDAKNTGLLTRLMPTLDLDICNEEAVRALEDHVREHHEERGPILVRIGLPPKRVILFRTNEPFAKFVVNLIAPNGSEEKIEFLAAGAQVAAFGIHPKTNQPYRWFGGAPGKIAREELPYIREQEARALVDELVQLLVDQFGYTRAKERRKAKGNGKGGGEDIETGGGAEDWQYLIDNIHAGRALHDSLRDLAAKLIASGMVAGAAVNQLRALMEGSTAPRDNRFKERYDDIPRLVETAEDLVKAPPEAPATPGPPISIARVMEVFDHWLVLKSATPVYATLGAIAGNLLPGEPIWLGLIGPPSSAKTEILNSTAQLPHVVQATTLTCAALLSGTPKRQRDKNAKGGLLRQIGDFGIISLKDFGSVLSMHAETRAELLAMLREVYDGAVTRHFGIDGGKTLSWQGKVGMIFAATPVIDSYYGVIGSMGDRFLMSRLAPAGRGQGPAALKHRGATTRQMREELAAAVASLFAGRRAEPRAISDAEIEQMERTILLAVRLRGAVERDRRTREMEMILGAEGPARLMLTLERLLAGFDTLGVKRALALEMIESVALDSVPPTRLAAYRCVQKYGDVETADVAIELGLPTITIRRVLEDLAAYGLVERQGRGQGKADHWLKTAWEQDE
jgi:hypothetical protein